VSSDGRRALWSCPCQDAQIAAEDQARIAQDAAYRQAQAERVLGDTGLRLIEDLTWETLDVTKNQIARPLEQIQRWFAQALAYGSQASYRDPESPPAAIWVYSDGKGRGKTHLAAGAFHAARQAQKLACFIEENSYLRRRWGCDFEEVEQVVNLPADRAWLTVIDDLGRRQGMKNMQAVANVWFEVFNQRWLKRGWTVVTSNYTPEQLFDLGTLDDATYSRVRQMTRGYLVRCTGDDYRLEVSP
jgi:predicted ATPase